MLLYPKIRAGSQFHARGNSAFTLIELMVVIVLVAIMTALIIPEMKGTFQDALLRSSGRQLIEVFNLANSRAVSLNQIQRVRMDAKAGRYSIEEQAGPGSGEGLSPVRDISGGTGTLDERISLDMRKGNSSGSDAPDGADSPATNEQDTSLDALDTISFYPDGTAEAAELQLRDQSGLRLTLRINPVTARVQIIEPPDQ